MNQKISENVFSAVDTVSGMEVAVKFRESNKKNSIFKEGKLLRFLRDKAGFPAVYWIGTENGLNIIVMELLGPSLQKIISHTCFDD